MATKKKSKVNQPQKDLKKQTKSLSRQINKQSSEQKVQRSKTLQKFTPENMKRETNKISLNVKAQPGRKVANNMAQKDEQLSQRENLPCNQSKFPEDSFHEKTESVPGKKQTNKEQVHKQQNSQIDTLVSKDISSGQNNSQGQNTPPFEHRLTRQTLKSNSSIIRKVAYDEQNELRKLSLQIKKDIAKSKSKHQDKSKPKINQHLKPKSRQKSRQKQKKTLKPMQRQKPQVSRQKMSQLPTFQKDQKGSLIQDKPKKHVYPRQKFLNKKGRRNIEDLQKQYPNRCRIPEMTREEQFERLKRFNKIMKKHARPNQVPYYTELDDFSQEFAKLNQQNNEIMELLQKGKIMPLILPECARLSKHQVRQLKDIDYEKVKKRNDFSVYSNKPLNIEINDDESSQDQHLSQWQSYYSQGSERKSDDQVLPTNENFQDYYFQGTEYVYNILPNNSFMPLSADEKKSAYTLVKNNYQKFDCSKRYFYKNFDEQKLIFCNESLADKRYIEELLVNYALVLPELEQIFQRKYADKFNKGLAQFDYEKEEKRLRQNRNRRYLSEDTQNDEQNQAKADNPSYEKIEWAITEKEFQKLAKILVKEQKQLSARLKKQKEQGRFDQFQSQSEDQQNQGIHIPDDTKQADRNIKEDIDIDEDKYKDNPPKKIERNLSIQEVDYQISEKRQKNKRKSSSNNSQIFLRQINRTYGKQNNSESDIFSTPQDYEHQI